VVIFLYICEMNKVYWVYVLHHYDENIEENNVSGQYLTRNAADKQEEFGSWVADRYRSDIESILKNIWDKEDVSEFVKENPENISETFIVHKTNYHWKKGEKNYYYFCPLKEQREKLLNQIL